MRFSKGDTVWLDGKAGTIVALVRSDDDPRKCTPPGERFAWRGSVGLRDDLTYLVRVDGVSDLRWSFRHAVLPRLPTPASSAGRRRSILEDAKTISTGTMSYLTGHREYSAIGDLHRCFLQHVIATEASGARYESWIDAWRWFVNGTPGDALPAYSDLDRHFLICEQTAAVHKGRQLVASPDGATVVCVDSPVGALEAIEATGVLNAGTASLIRVGFVLRHWLGPKDQALLEEWVAGRTGAAIAA